VFLTSEEARRLIAAAEETRFVVCTAVFAPACLGALLLTRSLTRADRELLLRCISLRALLGRDSR
jgi:hypothetical protein